MKLNYPRTFTVGLAFFSICAFWQLYDHVVPLMLKFTFGINDAVAGGVMAIDNVLALFMLPLFGTLSDKTRTRWGRRMPYIVLGGFASCAAMMLIPVANRYASLPLFVAGLGLTLLLMATYRSPAVALMPDVTVKPLRSMANAVINLMGAVGGMIILVLTPVMLPSEPGEGSGGLEVYSPDYVPLFLLCMGIMVVATLVLILRVNEPKLVAQMHKDAKTWGVEEDAPDTPKNTERVPLPPEVRRSMMFLLASVALWFMGYNAVTTSFSKYCAVRFGIGAGGSARVLLVATVAAVVSYLPVGALAQRIGRKKVILGGVGMLGVAFAAGGFFPDFTPLLYPLFVMAGMAWAAININSYPMVVEMSRGADVGRFTGYYYTASMAAQTLTPILSGAALEYINYWTLFPYGALFVGLSFITMLFVRHGDSRPEPPANKLEAFEEMDG
ncbi:MFS transporter [Ruminococcaceae bacterium OttesenSCG-928-D13]|nr:MFS transporter [Ruminococcaceae bacterium OttesenSCG-928-D13]